jgi:hypothetical protein
VQSLLPCLAFLALGAPVSQYLEFYAEVLSVGMICSVVSFGLMTKISKRLMFVAFLIAGVPVPPIVIVGPNLLECGRLWNCDPRLEGAGIGLVASLMTLIWICGEFLIGLIAAIIYFDSQAHSDSRR